MNVKLYLLPLAEAEKIPTEYALKYFPKRVEKAKTFARKEDRLRLIGSGALLFGLLSLTDNDISYTEKGKPFAKNLRFNLSHSGDYIVLALGEDEVGVDIEKIDEQKITRAKDLLSEEEYEYFAGESKRFFALWTMKESLVKLQGSSLPLSVKSLDVLPLIKEGCMSTPNGKVYARSQKIDGHMLSVCSYEKTDGLSHAFVSANDLLK